MGNTSKKLAAKCTLLTREEQKNVAATFRAASRNSEKIREDDLIKFWGPQIDPRLAQYLSNYLFGFGPNKTQTVDFNRFAELYVYNVRGTLDERVTATYNSLALSEGVELPYQLLKEYCESLASTYIKIIKSSPADRNAIWLQKGFSGSASHVQSLGEAVAATVWANNGPNDAPGQTVTLNELTKWLQTNTLLPQLSELVFSSLYGIVRRHVDDVEQHNMSLLPYPEGLESMPDYPAITDISHVAWLNSQLPTKLQHKWRFLFSSHIHGESFSTMAGRIIDQGPSVMIIQDTNNYIFGGFATDSWSISANWVGNDTSFLFTLVPKMRCYPATSYNDHYQYMNHHTKTMPNGIIMGGQFEFAGIFISADPFGDGSSAESCTTYRGYRRLSKEGGVKIRAIEVWGVGEKPLLDKEEMRRTPSKPSEKISVLDTHAQDRLVLDLMGKKTTASDGYRDDNK